MVQPNLPSRSAYSNTQQTYLRRNYFFKKWDGERRQNGVLIRKRTYNVSKKEN